MVSQKTKNLVKQALEEDIDKRDITTSLIIPPGTKSEGIIILNEEAVLCGIEVAQNVFHQIDKKAVFRTLKRDGDVLKKGEKIAVIAGEAKTILTGERVALNFLSLLSGISTFTRKFVDKIEGCAVKIMDTRKTTPVLRELEKYAVTVGGGYNHRDSLYDGILVKDNHLKVIKCVYEGAIDENKMGQLISLLRSKTPLKIEVEVENLLEFKTVIKYKPDIIMLDNFSLKDLKAAVKLRNECFSEIKIEASGGVNLNTVEEIAHSGVDYISIGRITHSAQAVDFSLEIPGY